MLLPSSAKVVGFLLTRDYDQARAFYEGKLGFQFVSQDQYALVLRAGENNIRIVKAPDFTPLRNTVLGWEVSNVEEAAAKLKNAGVALEIYPWVQDRDLGIWTTPGGDKVSWFKDPDGNVLSLSEHPKS